MGRKELLSRFLSNQKPISGNDSDNEIVDYDFEEDKNDEKDIESVYEEEDIIEINSDSDVEIIGEFRASNSQRGVPLIEISNSNVRNLENLERVSCPYIQERILNRMGIVSVVKF